MRLLRLSWEFGKFVKFSVMVRAHFPSADLAALNFLVVETLSRHFMYIYKYIHTYMYAINTYICTYNGRELLRENAFRKLSGSPRSTARKRIRAFSTTLRIPFSLSPPRPFPLSRRH